MAGDVYSNKNLLKITVIYTLDIKTSLACLSQVKTIHPYNRRKRGKLELLGILL